MNTAVEEEGINMTPADNTAPLSGEARQSLLARHPLVFFLIAYAGAWLAGCHR